MEFKTWREMFSWSSWSSSVPSPSVLAAGATVGAVSCYCAWHWYQTRNLPPGPIKWPLFGTYNAAASATIDKDVFRLSKVYGDVYSFQLGTTLIVVLASHSAIKEALVRRGDLFAGKPDEGKAVVEFMDIKDDMFATPYHTEGWNQNKAFLLSTLRGAGFGTTKSAEEKILEQVQLLASVLDVNARNSTPLNLKDILPKATTNILFQIFFNKTFQYDDPEFAEVLDVIHIFLKSFGESAKYDSMPRWFVRLFYQKQKQLIRQRTQRMREIIQKEVLFHKETIDLAHSRDFIDDYMIKKGKEYSLERIVENTLVLIPDSCDTLAMVIEIVFLYITYYPNVQQKILDEITDVTGGNRNITWADRSSLPYTEAVIMECIRCASPFTSLPAHAVSRETVFRGYRIPTNAHIIASLSAAHNDPANYTEPNTFMPERFLENGVLLKSDIWIPFGMGRRKCPGEQIAKIELFLFTANLVLRYNFSFPEGESGSLVPGSNSVIRVAETFKVILSHRQ